MNNTISDKIIVDNPDVWRRLGRGKYTEFDISAADFSCVLSGNPEIFSPDLILISCWKDNECGKYRELSDILKLEDIVSYVEKGRWQFFLGSLLINPELGFYVKFGVADAKLSTLGLINIQCGRRTRLGVAKTSIGIVDKIKNVETGEVICHEGYLSLFF